MNNQDLAEKIAGYAKIRLCTDVEGLLSPGDWLLSEANRVSIVKMLRDPRAYANVELSEENDRLIDENKKLRDLVRWVETWVSNPIGAFSVSALDGLFAMTRDRITALYRDHQ